jgi:hypothetical protein
LIFRTNFHTFVTTLMLVLMDLLVDNVDATREDRHD